MKEEIPRIPFGEIKRAIRHNKKLTKKDEGGYETEEKEWREIGVYDSSLQEFGGIFTITLPESLEKEKARNEQGFLKNPKIFQEYIEKTLSEKKKGDLTAIELGGSGSQLFGDFTKGFFRKTVGVCLKDIRDYKKQEEDRENNHSIIEADILDVRSDELHDKIAQALGTKKTDLIISRMFGPLQSIDKHPVILDRVIRNWYNMLNENGLMFIQFQAYVPRLKDKLERDLIEKWSAAMRKESSEIDIQVNGGVLRLHKREGSPEKLPSASELFK